MADPAPSLRKAMSVTELTRKFKRVIEDNIKYVWVEGEISQHKVHGPSRHHYFTLKDEENILNCAMWRSFASRLRFKPKVGLEVFAFGRIDIYPPRGTYQLLVEKMEPKGVGVLQLRFEELKKKLEKEGLFDPTRKRTVPMYPQTVGIVTSPSGAAVRDMLEIIRDRYPKVTVLIYPVLVQGEGAAEQVAQAISEINLSHPEVDILIVGRGGGSLEDLWAFNEEVVARAIHASRIPVISAVGHQTDVTIADFVADIRAATPTEAAVLAVPDLRELMESLARLDESLARRPRELFEQYAMRVDELHDRLRASLTSAAWSLHERLDRNGKALHSALPRLVVDVRQRLDHHEHGLELSIERFRAEHRRVLDASAARLEALSPLRVLGRGFSITLDNKGKSIRDAKQIRAGDQIVSRLEKGSIRSRVEETLE